jgi:hypothetical protein
VSDCLERSVNSNTSTVFTHTTTYNGTSWSDGSPDSNKSVVFNSNLTITAPMSACSCQVNAGVNVVVESDLKIENGLTVDPTGNQLLRIMPV